MEAGRAFNRMVAKLWPLFVLFTGDSCSEDGIQHFYENKVEKLSEEDMFKIPENIMMHENAGLGNVVKYPFRLN